MKKALQYIKYNLILTFKLWPNALLMFVIFPIVLGYFLAFSNRETYDVKPEPPEYSVYIKNEDKTQTGDLLNQIFDQMAKEKLIVKEKRASDADFTLTIPKNFSQSLSEGRVAEWTITLGEDISKEEGQYFQMLLQPISNQLQELPQLERLTTNPELAQKILAGVNKALETLTITEEQIVTKLSLTSNQYYAPTFISFIMLTVISAGILAAVKPELQGYQKRLKLLPMTPMERTVLNWICNIVAYSFWIGLYVLTWKVIDPATFAGNPLLYAILIPIQIAFLLGIAELIGLFVTESTAGAITSLLSVVWMLFSGMLPLDKIGGMSHLKILQENWIERIFVWPFKLIVQGDGLGAYLPLGSVITLIGILSLTLSIIILRKKEVS